MAWTGLLVDAPELRGVDKKLKAYCRNCGVQDLRAKMRRIEQRGGKLVGFKHMTKCTETGQKGAFT